MNPFSAVIKAVTFPFRALFVVGVCFAVNWFTSPDHWWAQWVLFGMAIATLAVWLRALRVVVTGVGLLGGAFLIHRWWKSRARGNYSTSARDA